MRRWKEYAERHVYATNDDEIRTNKDKFYEKFQAKGDKFWSERTTSR